MIKKHNILPTFLLILSIVILPHHAHAGFSLKKTFRKVKNLPKKAGKEFSRIPGNLKKNKITKPLGELGEEVDTGIRKVNEVQKKTFKEAERTFNHGFEKIEEETGVTFGPGVQGNVSVPVGDNPNDKSVSSTSDEQQQARQNRSPAGNAANKILSNLSEFTLGSYVDVNLNSYNKSLDALRTSITSISIPASRNEIDAEITRLNNIIIDARTAHKTVQSVAKSLDEESYILDQDGLIRFQLRTSTSNKINKVINSAKKRVLQLKNTPK